MSLSELSSKTVGIGKITFGELFSALITLLVCILIIRLTTHVLRRLLHTSKLDARVQKYFIFGVRMLLYVITIVVVIEQVGIDSSSLVALLSVASLGVTLAAESILGNVAGGLVILSSHPFSIGDYIEVSGTSGTVEEIKLNHTKLITLDGLTVMIPNKALSDSKMTNYSALGRRRVARNFSASYDAPTDVVKTACYTALSKISLILDAPSPSVYLSEYGSSSIEYSIYCWCRPEDYWSVFYQLGENLRTAFDEAHVQMTYDHLNVHVVEEGISENPNNRLSS